MTPHKVKKLNQDTAEELDISTTLVDNLIEFYYKNVRENLSELTHPRLNIEGLGQFVIKNNSVNKAIPKYEKVLNAHDTSTFVAYHNKKIVEDRLKLLKNIKIKLDMDTEIKKDFKIKKYEEYIKINLDKSQADSGGDNQ